jgi:hypothetical protein
MARMMVKPRGSAFVVLTPQNETRIPAFQNCVAGTS